MSLSLLREYVSSVVAEAAVDPKKAGQQGLGLVEFGEGGDRKLVLFDVKRSAEAIVAAVKAGKTGQDAFMDALESTVCGFVHARKPKQGKSWGALNIRASAALKGYGPMMYDIAMSKFGRIMPDRDSVSPSAENVWAYYANKRPDVTKMSFDDIEDPQTPSPEDDAQMHVGGPRSPLNAAYTGAKVDTSKLEKNAAKWFAWAEASGLEKTTISNALKYAGSGFFRDRFMHSD